VDRIPTGIAGLDHLTGGGLPRGRTTVIVGGPGCGKTVCALQSLTTAARNWGEPGIFVAFEERAANIVAHAASFGWDLPALQKKKLFFLDAQLSPAVIQGGAFDLSGLLAALGAKVRQMGARRVVFDGLDALLDLLGDPVAERREAYRLREWLDETGLTGIVTAKTDSVESLSSQRYSYLQYLADCVILMQHRLVGQTAVRGVRVMKYRGVAHSANETPFLISPSGIEVGAVERAEMTQRLSSRRVSTGIARLDTMLGGGYYRGSTALVSGAPGTAKSTLAAAFAAASGKRKDRTLYVSFDEPAPQIIRNMRSVGIDLDSPRRNGSLRLMSFQARGASAEEHVVKLRSELRDGGYRALVIDPVSALAQAGGSDLSTEAVQRLLYTARELGVTTVVTAVVDSAGVLSEATSTAISTIADTWMQLSYVVRGGERNRALTVIKSRGTAHSNQVRELVLSRSGLTLSDVYMAGGEVLMGTLRWQKEQEEAQQRDTALREVEHCKAELELTIARGEAQLELARRETEARKAELVRLHGRALDDVNALTRRRQAVRSLRRADSPPHTGRRPAVKDAGHGSRARDARR
jgi:circadian clock protein KaiC